MSPGSFLMKSCLPLQDACSSITMNTGSNSKTCHYSQREALSSPKSDKADFLQWHKPNIPLVFAPQYAPVLCCTLLLLPHVILVQPLHLNLADIKTKAPFDCITKALHIPLFWMKSAWRFLPFTLHKAARMLELLTLVLTTFVPAHRLKTVMGIIWNQTVQILTLSRFQCSSWNSHPPDTRLQVNKVSDRIWEKLTEHHRSNSSGKEDTNRLNKTIQEVQSVLTDFDCIQKVKKRLTFTDGVEGENSHGEKEQSQKSHVTSAVLKAPCFLVWCTNRGVGYLSTPISTKLLASLLLNTSREEKNQDSFQKMFPFYITSQIFLTFNLIFSSTLNIALLFYPKYKRRTMSCNPLH